MGRRHSLFKKVLIGHDGSTQADRATERALALASSLDAKVLLFAVARPPEPATMVEVDAMLDDARQHYEEHFKKIVQRAKDLGVDLETDIAVGHPVEQIVGPFWALDQTNRLERPMAEDCLSLGAEDRGAF